MYRGPRDRGRRRAWSAGAEEGFDRIRASEQFPAMRLSDETISAIREEVVRSDPAAEVWLFGSRVDDAARGGDIDLLVVSDRINFAGEMKLRTAILGRIGWQRLDLVVRPRTRLADPIAEIALQSGIRL